MRASLATLQSRTYLAQLTGLTRLSLGQLVGGSSHPNGAAAGRRLSRQLSWLILPGAVTVIVLMVGFDATEIGLMPPRGTPSLWPLRILTDFGRDAYLIAALAGLLLVTALAWPASRAGRRVALLHLGTRLEYLLLAVSVPVLFTEVIKWGVGRGRPFVGGKADPFNFHPFHGTEAYFSFPSAHAVTAFALAFGVASIWPRARLPMAIYAVAIALTRLVLLAHHPSDVVAGAVIGIGGAMAVRAWFAVRRLGFAVDRDGGIVAR
jgi:membrane-associated phospholipid phosphatase